jgi:hypothetical protein
MPCNGRISRWLGNEKALDRFMYTSLATAFEAKSSGLVILLQMPMHDHSLIGCG